MVVVACAGMGVLASSSVAADGYQAPRTAPAGWLDRLPSEDRTAVTGWTGYLPPNFDRSLRWIKPGGEAADRAPSWLEFYDKVVVLQSWSSADEESVARLDEIAAVVGEFSALDVQLIALHTPEKADDAEAFIRAHGGDWPHLTVIDPQGDFCDRLGVYRTPVNFVIGRNRDIRYAGLSPRGVQAAINALIDEDPFLAPAKGSRPVGPDGEEPARGGRAARSGSAAFPPPNPNPRAVNLVGQRGPEFHAQTWLTNEPETIGGNVTVIEFFRTGCPHCVNAIPHMNDLADRFGDQVTIITLSGEQRAAFEQGLSRRQLTLDSFEHAVALDPANRFRNGVRPQGVPNAIVLDSDWVVRWQGHPVQLTESLLGQIVSADASQRGSALPPKRWKAEREGGAEFDRRRQAADRAAAARQRDTADGFPPAVGDTRSTVDLRGKPGPEFHVQTWITDPPEDLGENVTVIEFFAAWCPHCRNAIPKMNEMAAHFGDRVNIIAISNEDQATFDENLRKHSLSPESFSHPVAIDTANSVRGAVQPRGVPYAMVLGSDWTVRWQGHPNSLSTDLLERIIRADEARRAEADPAEEGVPLRERADAGEAIGERRQAERRAEATKRPADFAPASPRWLDPQLSPEDRNPIDLLLGHAPPGFTDDVEWIGEDAGNHSWDDFRDRVVVIQSWSGAAPQARSRLVEVAQVLGAFSPTEVQLIGLHTPDGAAGAADAARRLPSGSALLAVDPVGRFCDEMGMYRTPVNLVVDRNGVVRYAGLTPHGLRAAVFSLLDESHDPAYAAEPVPRAEFPAATESLGNTPDRRGTRAPRFNPGQWVTDPVDVNGRVVVLEMWATWCPHCRNAIPKMNDLARAFPEDVAVVAISDEQPDAFYEGLEKHNIAVDDFEFAASIDPDQQMRGPLGTRGVPHAYVLCSDGIVRWQGHPNNLSPELLGQIVEADRHDDTWRYRWTATRKSAQR